LGVAALSGFLYAMLFSRPLVRDVRTHKVPQRRRGGDQLAHFLDEFIEASNAAPNADALFALFQRATAEFGYDRLMYSVLSRDPMTGELPAPAVMRNYPDDWIAHYVKSGYVDTDPVRRRGMRSWSPFVWSDVTESPDLSSAERRLMDEADEAGLHDGVGIPLHGPNGEAMGVGMASSVGGADARANLRRLHLLSVQFHTAWLSLKQPDARRAAPVLSPREREVLRWCRDGKSNWAIGEIMGISNHGVDFHLRNILRKLKADSRITAVVKALHLGLIDP
jgi:DNA-binding CsgD family transcriptional regulator